MIYEEIIDSANTLNLLATDRTLRLSSAVLGFQAEFPMFFGGDYVAINAFDMSKAVELHACTSFPLGHMIYFPDSHPVISERLAMLDCIG
jgi:hypothetical protein